MNGTTEVPQEYDQRDMFFFVHAGLVPEKQISISEFRRTIYNPGLAEMNELSWFPPANRASSVMESSGADDVSTPQVDTVGVADPIETKTKARGRSDAYLGRLSGRAAPSSEVPEGQLGEQGQERKKVTDKGAGWSGALGRRGPRWTWMLEKAVSSLAPMLGESVNGKLLAISEAQESRRKKAHQKEGGPRNDVVRLAAAEAIDLARMLPRFIGTFSSTTELASTVS
ncbi:hypothetical protein L1987_89050 [Smallanthus sonchifolius]|nr:hypothetical protein L1987_89050 [Smallanthus sonchifolius]